jgi:hypothetical protein
MKFKKEVKLPKEVKQVSALCEVPSRDQKEPPTLWVGTDRYIVRLSGNKVRLIFTNHCIYFENLMTLCCCSLNMLIFGKLISPL